MATSKATQVAIKRPHRQDTATGAKGGIAPRSSRRGDELLRLLLLILASLAFVLPASAQTPGPTVDPIQGAAIDKASADLHDAVAGLHTRTLTDDEIRRRLALIPGIQDRLTASLSVLTPRLQDSDARLAQLGPAPGPNMPPESPDTAAARRNALRLREAIDSQVKQARLLNVVAEQAARALGDQLRSNFEARLWTRNRSIIDPSLLGAVSQALPDEAARLTDIMHSQATQMAQAARAPWRALVLILSALAAIVLVGPARFVLNRLGYRRAGRMAEGSPARRSGMAIWLVLVAVLTPFLACLVARGALQVTGALDPDFDELFWIATRAIAVAALIEGLGRALLSPGKATWRVAPLADSLVDRVAPYPGLIALAAGINVLLSGIDSALANSLATAVAGERLTVGLEILAIGVALIAMSRAERSAEAEAGAAAHGASRIPWVLAAIAAWVAIIAALMAVLAGYVALAGFLMRETMWIGALLAILFLLLRFVDDVVPLLLSSRTPVGRLLRGPVGLHDQTIEHTSVLVSGVVSLLLLLVAWSAILLPLGASPGDILTRVTSAQAVFKLGQFSISPSAVISSIALFFIGLAITRALRGWLERRYLPKTKMDIGVRTSLAALFSYLGIAIALLLAFASLGLSFSQIALFASALSVGIGFGLQAIIGNFVSGLILLVERPVKVGDWVAIGDLEGDVRAINIRATEIQMWDRSTLIVPNSELVSKTVRNVTHADALGRVRIVLHLDLSLDPSAVRDVILTRLLDHPDTLAQPAPAVFFTDVKETGLEFTAIAYVSSPRRAFGTKSELLFEIIPDLQRLGMPLASTTSVVNVSLPEPTINPTAS